MKKYLSSLNHNYLLADTLHKANDFRPLLRNYQALSLMKHINFQKQQGRCTESLSDRKILWKSAVF